MRYSVYILFAYIYPISIFSQSSFSQFKELSRPEKAWAIGHLFKAKKAFNITNEVLFSVDSIKRTGVIGKDINGGNLDAFKHSYWMASLTSKIGKRKALKLGKAHERANYLQFKEHQLEDAILPDSISSLMDLRNNQMGASLVVKGEKISKTTIQWRILDAINKGKLIIIKKDEQGNYLTCEGEVIILKNWFGKWNVPKCLTPSFSH